MKSIQTRAVVMTGLTLAAIIFVFYLYGAAVARGHLPSPTGTLITRQPPPRPPADTNTPPRELAPQESKPAQPLEFAPALVSDPFAGLEAPRIFDPELEHPMDVVPEPARPVRQQITLPPSTRADELTAARWLSTETNRPNLRVRYESATLIELLSNGSGCLLATSVQDPKQIWQLYSPNEDPPSFVVLSPKENLKLARVIIGVEPKGELSRFTAPLRRLMPEGFQMGFAPSVPLASEIFSEIARATRGMGLESATELRGEGQLVCRNGEPNFELLWLHVGSETFRVDRGQ